MRDELDYLTIEIRQRLAELGFDLVDLRRGGSRRRPVLQVRIDRPDSAPGRGVTVDDCAATSRALEPWLDQEAVLGERYVLEVSSPGIERPVRWEEHWKRFEGHDVNVKLEGRGRVRAKIVEAGDGKVVLKPVGGDAEITVPLDEAHDATLAVDWN